MSSNGIYLDNYSLDGQSLSFSLHAPSPAPLGGTCKQDVDKVEINTCE